MIKKILNILFFSVLLFFSISFLTVFNHLFSPFNKIVGYKNLEIGFPLKYYEQFMVACPNLHHGWNIKNLIFDVVFAFILVYLTIFLNKMMMKKFPR